MYELVNKGNSIVSLSLDEGVELSAEIYSMICHNSSILIPGTRDLSAVNTVNYDTLGSVPMLEELENNSFDKKTLFNFVLGILNVLEKIFALGIEERQIVFDCSYMFLSLYDKSVRFICIPVSKEKIECDSARKASDMFKKLALEVKSDGAYELVGYIIEKTSSDDFSLSEFKRGLEEIFSKNSAAQNVSRPVGAESSQILFQQNYGQLQSQTDNMNSVTTDAVAGREYIPEGIPFAYGENISEESNTIAPDNKTQVLFSGTSELDTIPYLSPVDNNSPEARIYVAGEKLTIGRSSENDLQINVATVSGKHAEIHRSGGKCIITDLNSTNKTYVNGNMITPNIPVKLNHQDLIAFNKVRYRFFEH